MLTSQSKSVVVTDQELQQSDVLALLYFVAQFPVDIPSKDQLRKILPEIREFCDKFEEDPTLDINSLLPETYKRLISEAEASVSPRTTVSPTPVPKKASPPPQPTPSQSPSQSEEPEATEEKASGSKAETETPVDSANEDGEKETVTETETTASASASASVPEPVPEPVPESAPESAPESSGLVSESADASTRTSEAPEAQTATEQNNTEESGTVEPETKAITPDEVEKPSSEIPEPVQSSVIEKEEKEQDKVSLGEIPGTSEPEENESKMDVDTENVIGGDAKETGNQLEDKAKLEPIAESEPNDIPNPTDLQTESKDVPEVEMQDISEGQFDLDTEDFLTSSPSQIAHVTQDPRSVSVGQNHYRAFIGPDRVPEKDPSISLAELHYKFQSQPLSKLIPAAHKVITTENYKLSLLEGRLAVTYNRIEELKKSGYWGLRQRKQFLDPPREFGHADYLLEEMKWMRECFHQELLFKQALCHEISQMVLDHFHQKEASESPVVSSDSEPAQLHQSLLPITEQELPLVVYQDDLDKFSLQLLSELPIYKGLQGDSSSLTSDNKDYANFGKFGIQPDNDPYWRRLTIDHSHPEPQPEEKPLQPATTADSKERRFRFRQHDVEVRPPPPPDARYMTFRHTSVWLPSEDAELQKLASQLGYNWELIATYLSPHATKGYTASIERRTPWQCFERWLQLSMNFDIKDLRGRWAEQARIWLDAAQRSTSSSRRRQAPIGVAQDNLQRGHKRLRWASLLDGIRKVRRKREQAPRPAQPNAATASAIAAAASRRQAAASGGTAGGVPAIGPVGVPKVNVPSAADLSRIKYERDKQLADQYVQHRQAQQLQAQARLQQGHGQNHPMAGRDAGNRPGQPGQPVHAGHPQGVQGAQARVPPTGSNSFPHLSRGGALGQLGQAGQTGQVPGQAAASHNIASSGQTVQNRLSGQRPDLTNEPPPSIAGLPMPASVAAAARDQVQAAEAQRRLMAQQNQRILAAGGAAGVNTSGSSSPTVGVSPIMQQAMLQQARLARIRAQQQAQAQQAQAQQAQQAQGHGQLPSQTHQSPLQSPQLGLPQSIHRPPSGSDAAAAAAAAGAGLPNRANVPQRPLISPEQLAELMSQIAQSNPNMSRQEVQRLAVEHARRYLQQKALAKQRAQQAQAQALLRQGSPDRDINRSPNQTRD